VPHDDLDKFFAVIDDMRDRAMFTLLLRCGLRLGEVEELRVEDLDLANRKLMVRQGKGRKDRAIYLTDTAMHAVREYLTVRGQGALRKVAEA
jgi:site-specific recombinase XerC